MANISSKEQAHNQEVLSILPPELRNKIYRNVLILHIPIDVAKDDVISHTSLLRTCRQIRTEGIKLFYAENSFRFAFINENETKVPTRWLASLSEEYARCITNLSVELKPCEAVKTYIERVQEARGTHIQSCVPFVSPENTG